MKRRRLDWRYYRRRTLFQMGGFQYRTTRMVTKKRGGFIPVGTFVAVDGKYNGYAISAKVDGNYVRVGQVEPSALEEISCA